MAHFQHREALHSLDLFSLNTWLAKTCFFLGMNFIDNFNLFWNHRAFFRPHSTELSWTGAKVLADHYRLSLYHATFSLPTLGPPADKRSVTVQTEPIMVDKDSVGVQTETDMYINKHSETKQWPSQSGREKCPITSSVATLDMPLAAAYNACTEVRSLKDCYVQKHDKKDTARMTQSQTSAQNLPGSSKMSRADNIGVLQRSMTPTKAANMSVSDIVDDKDTTGVTQDSNEQESENTSKEQQCVDVYTENRTTTVSLKTPDLSLPSPSPPRLQFPASMQRLLPIARLSFSSPKHSKQAVHTDYHNGQAFASPRPSTAYASTTAPKNRRAPPPPPPAAGSQLQYTNSGSGDNLYDCPI